MTIPEFFNVYRVNYKKEGVVEFTVRENPIFIYLSQSYSNNRGWRSEILESRVNGSRLDLWLMIEGFPESGDQSKLTLGNLWP
jgi:hypothetical protein